MSGLDPGIHLQRKMDCRFKPGNDETKTFPSNAANSSALSLKFASLHGAFRSKLQIRKGTGRFLILAWSRIGNSLEALTEKIKRTSEPRWREDECIGC
jgi:hypothetical protein